MKRLLGGVAAVGLVLTAVVILARPSSSSTPGPEPAEPEPLLGPRAELVAPSAGPRPEGPALPTARAKVRANGGTRPARLAAVPVSVTAQRTVWIDPTEATVAQFASCVGAGACKAEQVLAQPDSPCNYGAPGRGEHPVNCVDWSGAEAYCRWTHGRLCKEEEWFAACKGPQGADYPYGSAFDASACNVAGQDLPANERGTTEVATLASCQGGVAGLFDMVGNVSEWLDACKDDYCHFYGGAFLNNDPVPDFASCKRLCAGNKKTFRSATIGFRCCHDAEPERK